MKQAPPLPPTIRGKPLELDDFVRAYEEARARIGHANLADFLPRIEHPLFEDALRELIRVDLELGWQSGRGKRLQDCAHEFPQLFRDPRALREVAFEEYRLRRHAGENPSPAEYGNQFGIDTEGWPQSQAWTQKGSHADARRAQHSETPDGKDFTSGDMSAAASAYQQFLQKGDLSQTAIESWEPGDKSAGADFFRRLHRRDPANAARLAQSLTTLPKVGTCFLGFRLIEELGRGAFGTVYLAEQGELADRPVALKVATDILGESHTLAQLQHTNIVPIYSVHRADPFQAVCMPFFGRTTLADVLRQLNGGRSIPTSGKILVTTLNNRRPSTRQSDSKSSIVPAVPIQADAADPAANFGKPVLDADAAVVLEKLGSMTYVNAVLWIGARLADGLAHAHERGILHLDLKPANILLTDDGQPMLLDFNLSEDIKLRGSLAASSIGGTLPYMSPEHLQALRGGSRRLDGRSDLFALGVILHELLTGRRPFQGFSGKTPEVIDQMIRERQKPLPAVHETNPAVTAAVNAIIQHCLCPDPQKRYARVRDLYEDLDRQLRDLPLKYAPEPSWRERGASLHGGIRG